MGTLSREGEAILPFNFCLLPSGVNSYGKGGGRVMRWCWVNFQCRDVLLIWVIVLQVPTALVVRAGGVVWTIFFSRLSVLSSFSLSLGDGPI